MARDFTLTIVRSSPPDPAAQGSVSMKQLERPRPPAELLAPWPVAFAPALDVTAWIRRTFVAADAPLVNPDHRHLRVARIGVVWTNAANETRQRRVLGTAELLPLRGSKWQQARNEYQLEQWFQGLPDFLVTLAARELAHVDDATFCAVVEHELYHCGQAHTLGIPRFSDSGRPIYALRAHDVEEFVGVVRRYGSRAAGVENLVQAANKGPEFTAAKIAGACGTCAARVA